MKVKVRSLIVLLACLLVVTIPYINQTANNLKNLLIEIVLTIWYISCKNKKEITKRNKAIFLFWVTMILCTLIYLSFSTRLVNAIVTGYSYVIIFLTFCYLSRKHSTIEIINEIFRVVFAYVIIEDLAIFLTQGRGVGSLTSVKYYLLGSKFFVSYTHLMMLALFLAHTSSFKKERTRKRVFWFLLVFSAFICYTVDCNTGIVGCLAIGIISLFINRRSKISVILAKPWVYLTVFIGSTFLLIGTNMILGNSFFQQLFLNFSHTNKLLTGRVDMYHVALAAIYKRPLLGYGINSTIVSDTLSWGNAQNGLLKMLLDFGVVGTVAFLAVCWDSFSYKALDSEDAVSFHSMIAFLYAMAICSMVEINISGYFFMALALIKSFRFQTGVKTINK